MSRTLGIETRPASSAEEAVRDRDIIITITAARDPVLSGSWIKPGAHINAAGSNALIRAEIDIETVQRAALIVVDSREQAKMECGDLLAPIERGLIHWDQVRELGEIVAGRFPGRTSDQDITLFESQGLAIEDMAVAAVVYARAKEQGVGRPLPS
jgi:ornithine cyclodeaminase